MRRASKTAHTPSHVHAMALEPVPREPEGYAKAPCRGVGNGNGTDGLWIPKVSPKSEDRVAVLETRAEAIAAIADYIDAFYNVTRLPLGDRLSPIEFELKFRIEKEAA